MNPLRLPLPGDDEAGPLLACKSFFTAASHFLLGGRPILLWSRES